MGGVGAVSWEGNRRECVDTDCDTGVSLVTVGAGNLPLDALRASA